MRTKPGTPPRHPWDPPPPRLTTRDTARRKQGSTGFWRIKQGYRRKNQGSDGKTGNQETVQKRRYRDDNIKSKKVASNDSLNIGDKSKKEMVEFLNCVLMTRIVL